MVIVLRSHGGRPGQGLTHHPALDPGRPGNQGAISWRGMDNRHTKTVLAWLSDDEDTAHNFRPSRSGLRSVFAGQRSSRSSCKTGALPTELRPHVYLHAPSGWGAQRPRSDARGRVGPARRDTCSPKDVTEAASSSRRPHDHRRRRTYLTVHRERRQSRSALIRAGDQLSDVADELRRESDKPSRRQAVRSPIRSRSIPVEIRSCGPA
jgi:hypothetical protein